MLASVHKTTSYPFLTWPLSHLISYLIFPPICPFSVWILYSLWDPTQESTHPAPTPSASSKDLIFLHSIPYRPLSRELLWHSLYVPLIWPLAYNILYYYLIFLCLCGLACYSASPLSLSILPHAPIAPCASLNHSMCLIVLWLSVTCASWELGATWSAGPSTMSFP